MHPTPQPIRLPRLRRLPQPLPSWLSPQKPRAVAELFALCLKEVRNSNRGWITMFVACAVQCDRRLSTNGTGHLAFERSAEPTRCAHARQQVRWPAASHPNDDKSLPPKRHSQASVESPVARMQHVVQIVEPPQTVHMPARLFARFSYHAIAARPAAITAEESITTSPHNATQSLTQCVFTN